MYTATQLLCKCDDSKNEESKSVPIYKNILTELRCLH